MAAAKKSSAGMAGGILVFLGSLIYLYVVFTWYNSGAALGAWVSATQFLGPFVVAVAMVSAITLFFMGIGTMSGKATGEMKSMMQMVLWRFVMLAGITEIIVTGGGAWFYAAILGFVLTYIGAMASAM
ncbi:MAG TPA: hypothetical protein VL945_00540 [Candidatus Saccharimonadales bacterium]|nr:hypothetical protein [Candidatus Saccharimonadales bacterium]